MSDQPISHYHVVFAEDSEDIAETCIMGLQWLVGIDRQNIHHFDELDNAKRHLETRDPNEPTIVILDNNTPRSGWKGYSLAMYLLERPEQFTNLFVVTISSSDMGLVTKDAGALIQELHSVGGEFWAKHTERNLMVLWIADCIRNEQLIPREEWLHSLGIDTRYRDTIEDKPPEEWKLFFLVDKLVYAHDPSQALEKHGLTKGCFSTMTPEQVFEALDVPRIGGEQDGNARKEK